MKWGLPAQGPQLQTLSSLQNAFTLHCQSAIFSFFFFQRVKQQRGSRATSRLAAAHFIYFYPGRSTNTTGKKKKKNTHTLLPPTPALKDTRAGCRRVWTTRADLLMKLKRKRARAQFRAVWGGNWTQKKWKIIKKDKQRGRGRRGCTGGIAWGDVPALCCVYVCVCVSTQWSGLWPVAEENRLLWQVHWHHMKSSALLPESPESPWLPDVQFGPEPLL